VREDGGLGITFCLSQTINIGLSAVCNVFTIFNLVFDIFLKIIYRVAYMEIITYVIPYTNGVREEAIHISRCIAKNVMINMGVIITIKQSTFGWKIIFHILRGHISMYLIKLS